MGDLKVHAEDLTLPATNAANAAGAEASGQPFVVDASGGVVNVAQNAAEGPHKCSKTDDCAGFPCGDAECERLAAELAANPPVVGDVTVEVEAPKKRRAKKA